MENTPRMERRPQARNGRYCDDRGLGAITLMAIPQTGARRAAAADVKRSLGNVERLIYARARARRTSACLVTRPSRVLYHQSRQSKEKLAKAIIVRAFPPPPPQEINQLRAD